MVYQKLETSIHRAHTSTGQCMKIKAEILLFVFCACHEWQKVIAQYISDEIDFLC